MGLSYSERGMQSSILILASKKGVSNHFEALYMHKYPTVMHLLTNKTKYTGRLSYKEVKEPLPI
jgi:hypothetical protein